MAKKSAPKQEQVAATAEAEAATPHSDGASDVAPDAEQASSSSSEAQDIEASVSTSTPVLVVKRASEDGASPSASAPAPAEEPAPELPPELPPEPHLPRPTYEDIKQAPAGARFKVRLRSGLPSPSLVAGLVVTSEFREHTVDVVRDCGESHMRALASDPTIEVVPLPL